MKHKLFVLFCISMVMLVGTLTEAQMTDADYKNLERLRGDLVKMKREVDKFVKEISSSDMTSSYSGYGQDVRVDVTEDANNYLVKADLPGMEKEKIEVTLEKSKILRIAGSRGVEIKEVKPGMVRQERMAGQFERTIELPGEGTAQGIKASYKDGVLDIVIPKKKVQPEDKVKIKVI